MKFNKKFMIPLSNKPPTDLSAHINFVILPTKQFDRLFKENWSQNKENAQNNMDG